MIKVMLALLSSTECAYIRCARKMRHCAHVRWKHRGGPRRSRETFRRSDFHNESLASWPRRRSGFQTA